MKKNIPTESIMINGEWHDVESANYKNIHPNGTCQYCHMKKQLSQCGSCHTMKYVNDSGICKRCQEKVKCQCKLEEIRVIDPHCVIHGHGKDITCNKCQCADRGKAGEWEKEDLRVQFCDKWMIHPDLFYDKIYPFLKELYSTQRQELVGKLEEDLKQNIGIRQMTGIDPLHTSLKTYIKCCKWWEDTIYKTFAKFKSGQ